MMYCNLYEWALDSSANNKNTLIFTSENTCRSLKIPVFLKPSHDPGYDYHLAVESAGLSRTCDVLMQQFFTAF